MYGQRVKFAFNSVPFAKKINFYHIGAWTEQKQTVTNKPYVRTGLLKNTMLPRPKTTDSYEQARMQTGLKLIVTWCWAVIPPYRREGEAKNSWETDYKVLDSRSYLSFHNLYMNLHQSNDWHFGFLIRFRSVQRGRERERELKYYCSVPN